MEPLPDSRSYAASRVASCDTRRTRHPGRTCRRRHTCAEEDWYERSLRLAWAQALCGFALCCSRAQFSVHHLCLHGMRVSASWS